MNGIPENVSEISCDDDDIIIRLTDGRIMGCRYTTRNGKINGIIYEEIGEF